MNTNRVAHLRVAPHNIAMRSIQGRLRQRAHALIMKKAMDNVTRGFGEHTPTGAGEPVVEFGIFLQLQFAHERDASGKDRLARSAATALQRPAEQ